MESTEVNKSWLPGQWKLLLLWSLAGVALAAILPIRLSAPGSDFATANVLTTILIVLSWLLICLGLALSKVPRRISLATLLLPLALLALFLAAYKFDRLDGELRPHFRPRWKTGPALRAKSETVGIAAAWLAPRESDFPQYLGAERNAVLPNIHLDPNWNFTPPTITWKHNIGDGWSGFAVQGDIALTMEQRNDQEWVSAYSVSDGALLWKYTIDARHTNVLGGTGPRSTPTISHNLVFACSAVSRCVCLELATGAEVWSQDLLALASTTQVDFEREVAWGRSASPLVLEDKVVVPLGGIASNPQTLIAFDRATGKELWRTGDDQISYASPALAELHGVRQIMLTSETKVAGYDIDSGSQLWSVPWPGSSSNNASASQPVLVDNSRVLLTKGYGEGAKLVAFEFHKNEWSVQTLWTNKAALRTKFTTAVLQGKYAYGLSDGILECLDIENGERQWKKGRYRQGQLLLVGEHLLITSENGEVVLVDASPKAFNEVAKLAVLGDVSWNTAALSGNRLLMRNSDEFACVLLPLAKLPASAME